MNRTQKQIVEYLDRSFFAFADSAKALSAAELAYQPNGGWTTHQILSHVMEVETLAFLPRLKLALTQNGAPSSVYSPEEWLNQRYRTDAKVTQMLAQIRTARRSMIKMLSTCSKSDWQSYVVHPRYGNLTVEYIASHAVDHMYEHLTDLWRARTLSTKK